MPRTNTLFIVATLATWLALALPAGAAHYPESSGRVEAATAPSGEVAAATRVLPPENEITSDGSTDIKSPAALTSASSARLPHKALDGKVLPDTVLPAPRASLARPFAGSYRQSPESTYPYGSRGNGRYVLHTGVDIANPMGTPVLAVANGQVVYAGDDKELVFGPRTGFYGNLVITRLKGAPETEPVYVLFGHLDRVLVTQGQSVSAGDVIGLVGMTGIAIGPHLHLEVRQGENIYQATRNPVLWLSSLPGRGTLAGRIVDEAGQAVAGERLLIYRAEDPSRVWRVVRSYLSSPLVHSDDVAGENFALPDVPAGDYRIVAGRSGGTVQIPVRIEAGRPTLVKIRVQGDR
jgi:murein DD-endopeptidase MepM/ murein hydrolase activator NlpD